MTTSRRRAAPPGESERASRPTGGVIHSLGNNNHGRHANCDWLCRGILSSGRYPLHSQNQKAGAAGGVYFPVFTGGGHRLVAVLSDFSDAAF